MKVIIEIEHVDDIRKRLASDGDLREGELDVNQALIEDDLGFYQQASGYLLEHIAILIATKDKK